MSKGTTVEGKKKTLHIDKTALTETAASSRGFDSSKGFDSTCEGRRKTAKPGAEAAGSTLDISHVSSIIRKNPKEHSRAFWNALKTLCTQKCGGAESAFRKFSDNKDGLMSFQNFQDLLEFMSLRFNPRTARVFFKQALAEGDVACSIQDFTGMLVVARIDRIRAALREYNCSLLRTSGHVDRFVSYLAMNTGEINQRRAITRFQRKFTLKFLLDLKTALQEWTVRRRWDSPEVLTDIDRDSFLKIVENVRTIQGYETEFLGNIFSHTDRRSSGRVPINDLLVIMTLVSADTSRRDKSGFLFLLFDLDGKGCLTQDQLLLMYCGCTIHAVIARGDKLCSHADVMFGDELSLAKARRLHEYTVERLAQSCVDEYCSFTEWWDAIGSNEMLLRELVPGTQSINWVTTGVGAEPAGADRGGSKGAPRSALRRSGVGQMAQKAHGAIRTLALVRAGPERRSQPMKAPGVVSAERFRAQATVRFRHALRGEWDDVDSLQKGLHAGDAAAASPRPELGASTGRSPQSTAADRLPTLDGSALARSTPDGSPQAAATEAVSMCTSEVHGLGWRQRQRTIGEGHQDSRGPRTGGLEASRSLPVLRGAGAASLGSSPSSPALGGTPARGRQPLALADQADGPTVAHVDGGFRAGSPPMSKALESTSRKVAEMKGQTSSVESPLEAHLFGKGALGRIRGLSEAKAKLRDDRSQEVVRVERVVYECKICKGFHEMSVACSTNPFRNNA